MKVKADHYFAMIPEWVLYGNISCQAVRVFGCLHRFANSQTAKCHPSRATIARLCGISIKSVDRALNELIDCGAVTSKRRWLDSEGEITENPAHGVEPTSNEYTISMTTPGADLTPPRVNLTLPQGKSDATPRDKNDIQTKAILNQSQEPEISSSSKDDGFTEFWAIYPRRIGKGAAQKAWVKALKHAPKETILAGVHTYAQLRSGEDPAFTAHPSTWLNQHRWDDEPDPHYQPLNRREQNIKEMFEYAATRTHNPFDLPTQGELNP